MNNWGYEIYSNDFLPSPVVSSSSVPESFQPTLFGCRHTPSGIDCDFVEYFGDCAWKMGENQKMGVVIHLPAWNVIFQISVKNIEKQLA